MSTIAHPRTSIAAPADLPLVRIEREFNAPVDRVYRAHVEPELLQQWLLGPDGWTMPVCIHEAKAGGAIRYEWSDGKGGGFHLQRRQAARGGAAHLHAWQQGGDTLHQIS